MYAVYVYICVWGFMCVCSVSVHACGVYVCGMCLFCVWRRWGEDDCGELI